MNPAVLTVRLLALLEKISTRGCKEDVHRLRTTVRRLEVQLRGTPPKIAKSLKSLRRKAGKVRDIDVHLGLLKPPLLPTPHRRSGTEPQSRSDAQDTLRKVLKDQRDSQAGKLRALVSETTPRLEARLPAFVEQRDQRPISLQDAHQQVSRARRRFLQWTRDIPSDERGLHELRIRIKKLRYTLEPLQAFDEAAELVEKFKQVQDAIGQWHDWATLEQLGGRHLDPSDHAPVLEALHARCIREYHRARRAAQTVRSWMNGQRSVAPVAVIEAPRIHKAG